MNAFMAGKLGGTIGHAVVYFILVAHIFSTAFRCLHCKSCALTKYIEVFVFLQ